jgi:Mrp family chromosome partitioning ATPase/capsular polysaccharide biosynthesis protein
MTEPPHGSIGRARHAIFSAPLRLRINWPTDGRDGRERIPTLMNETTDAATIFAPLWRRKWLILAVGILIAAGTYEYYKGKKPKYSASTQIYLGGGVEEQGFLGNSTPKKSTLNSANQTALINSNLIAEGVRKRLRAEDNRLSRSALRGKVSAKSKEKSLFITVTAEADTAGGAALLTNRIAQAYVARESATFRRVISKAIAVTRSQIRRLENSQVASQKKGATRAAGTSSAGVIQLAQLHSRENQLEAELTSSGVQQIGIAKPHSAVALGAAPKKNAIFGFVIGIVLASIAAYVLSRFDRRLRSLSDVEALFHTPILAALPTVKRPVVHEGGRPRPSAMLLEPLRRLHATLRVGETPQVGGYASGHSLLFLSAEAGDGKSTIIANLALVQRDAGARVLVIEADFRRPVQSKLLDLTPSHGLAEVLAGQLSAVEAMQTVGISRAGAADDEGRSGVATMVEARSTGTLSVLTSGAQVANPPALLASPAMSEALTGLSQEFDYLLIDAPSPLEVSDVIPLLPLVGGIVLVARVGHTREASARRLAELLERTTTTPVLGLIANHVRASDVAKYGFANAPSSLRRRRKS